MFAKKLRISRVARAAKPLKNTPRPSAKAGHVDPKLRPVNERPVNVPARQDRQGRLKEIKRRLSINQKGLNE